MANSRRSVQVRRAKVKPQSAPQPTGADAVDILIDLRVIGVRLIRGITEPGLGLGFPLGFSLLGEEAVDGGLSGGEGDALDDGDGLHGVFLLVCSLSLILL